MQNMKFVTRHRSDILAVLERSGVAETDIDFVKRRGRICIIHRESGQEFCYLRKQETRLDPLTRAWVDTQWFKVKSSNFTEKSVDNWEQVVKDFELWVHRVKF